MLPSNAKVVSLLYLLLYLTQGVEYLGTRLKAFKNPTNFITFYIMIIVLYYKLKQWMANFVPFSIG